jgi:hypothetical protein
VEDYGSLEFLVAHMKLVMTNREVYESYHAWRYKPMPDWWLHKYNITRTHSECRTCRWAYAMREKLSWDYETQSQADSPPAPTTAPTPGPKQKWLTTANFGVQEFEASGGVRKLWPGDCTSVLAENIPQVKAENIQLYRTRFVCSEVGQRVVVSTLRNAVANAEVRIDVLLHGHRGLFDVALNNASATLLPWDTNEIKWLVAHAEVAVAVGGSECSDEQPPVQEWPVAGPQRVPSYLAGSYSGQDARVSIVTQLSIDRLPRLAELAAAWGGPVSAALYIGFRGSLESELALLHSQWNESKSVNGPLSTFVDIHIVYHTSTSAWFATGAGHGINPYPVNLLRQFAMDRARTDHVLYLEGDMLTPLNGHDQVVATWGIMSKMAAAATRPIAFVLPMYSQDRHCALSKVHLLTQLGWKNSTVTREGDKYRSHRQLGYSAWENTTTTFLGYTGNGTSMPGGQEPYFIAPKQGLPEYDVLFAGMLGDKVGQLSDMSHGYDFYLHPTLFALDRDSSGLGDGWIAEGPSWRQGFVHAMHTWTVAVPADASLCQLGPGKSTN